MSLLVSIQDATEKLGYWSPTTSTIDWCERNYEVSHYVAEFVNSWTNLAFLFFGLLGLYSTYKTNSETRFYLCFLSYMLVGFGSFLFHGTLYYEMQLLDELPMIYGTSIFVYCLLQMFPDKRVKSWDSFHKWFLAIFSISVTFIYLYFKQPVIFHIAFAAITIVSALLPWFHFSRIAAMSERNKHIMKKIRLVFMLSTLSYIFGFSLWNIEQHLCGELRGWRVAIGYPFRILLELHGYWHLLAAYGTYTQLVTCQYARFLALKRSDVEIVYYMCIPVIIMKRSTHKARHIAFETY